MGDWVTDVGGWLTGAGQDIYNYATQNANWLLPLAATGGSILGSALQGGQQQNAINQAANQNLGTWRNTAYPNSGAIEAERTKNTAMINQAAFQANQNLGNTLAARGWGSGSGLGTRAASMIERGKLEDIGKMYTELTKFKNTPMWGPPSSAYVTPSTGAAGGAVGKGTSLLDMALGFSMMNKMLGGKQLWQGPTNPMQAYGQGGYSYYNPYDLYTGTAYNYGPSYSDYGYPSDYGSTAWDYGWSY